MQNSKTLQWLSYAIAIILFLAVSVQVGYRIGKEQIKVWDESSSARNAVIMLADGNYFMVKKEGHRVEDHKPPFQLWLKVASFKLFGINEFAVRFPTLLSALLTALLLWLFSALYLKNIWTGNLVLVAMAATSGYMGYHVARHGDPDTLLTFEVLVYSLFYFFFLEKYPKGRWKYLMLFGIALTIATLTKSIAGLAPVAGLLVYTLLNKNGRKALTDYRVYVSAVIILIMILSYYLIRAIFDEGYLQAVYAQNFEVLHKYPGTPKHPEFSFYFNYLWTSAFKPFIYFIPLVLIPLIWGNNRQLKKVIVFSLSVSLTFILGQSSALMKNEWYIAQVYPFLWLLFATGVYGSMELVLSFFANKQLRTWIAMAMGMLLLAGVSVKYNRIFKRNMQQTYTSNYIYEPEREGNFYRSLKEQHPEYKNLKVISDQHQRATDFYIQKYQYLDQTNSEVITAGDLPEIGLADTVMICSKGLKKQFEERYFYHILYNDRYCNLYVIDSLKNESDTIILNK